MFDANRAPILHRHQHYLQMDQNEIPHDPRHLGAPSGASKMFSEAVVCSAQTVHLSCIKISTFSKWTESSFQLGLVSKEYYQVRLKRFLSLRYVWYKPCTNLAPTPRLSLNGTEWDSTWYTSPWSSIGVSKMISEAMVRSAQIVHLSCTRLALSLNGLIRASTWAPSPRSTIGYIQNDIWACETFSTYRLPILHQV
jgi:hypothetical protein